MQKEICHTKISHFVFKNFEDTAILIIHPTALWNKTISVKCVILFWLNSTTHVAVKPYICPATSIITQPCMRFNSLRIVFTMQTKA